MAKKQKKQKRQPKPVVTALLLELFNNNNSVLISAPGSDELEGESYIEVYAPLGSEKDAVEAFLKRYREDVQDVRRENRETLLDACSMALPVLGIKKPRGSGGDYDVTFSWVKDTETPTHVFVQNEWGYGMEVLYGKPKKDKDGVWTSNRSEDVDGYYDFIQALGLPDDVQEPFPFRLTTTLKRRED